MHSGMRKIGMLCLALLVSAVFAAGAQAEIKIGVLAKRGAPKAMEKWGATGAYLTGKMGEKVTIIPLKFTAIEPMVKGGQIDFMLANSAFFVEMEKMYGVSAVATLINSVGGKAMKEFGGVILVRKDSPIQTLADIKGKKFMCVKYSSFGGAHMAWKVFLDNGIDPQKDFAVFAEGGKHDNVVLAVKKRRHGCRNRQDRHPGAHGGRGQDLHGRFPDYQSDQGRLPLCPQHPTLSRMAHGRFEAC